MRNLTMRDLVALHNELVQKLGENSPRDEAKPKSFSNKTKANVAIDELETALSEIEATPKAKRVTIRDTSEALLAQVDADGNGLAYETILEIVRDKHDSETSIACLRWYASKMRARLVSLPSRPRQVKQKEA